MKAIKGLMYFNLDMWDEGLKDISATAPEPFTRTWALNSRESHLNTDPSKALTGDNDDPSTWPIGMQAGGVTITAAPDDTDFYWVPLDNSANPSELDPRPTLAEAAAGTWNPRGSTEASTNFTLRQFCRWWRHSLYGSHFRGHGATIVSEMEP